MTHLSLEGGGKAEEGIEICMLEEAVVDFGVERIMIMHGCCYHDGRMMMISREERVSLSLS